MSAVLLSHVAEALRSHRQHLGASRVPSALLQLESELWVALTCTEPQSGDGFASLGNHDRVLLTTSEVAEVLSLSERKVCDLRATGRLRAVVIDRAVRFAVDDIRKFATDNKEI